MMDLKDLKKGDKVIRYSGYSYRMPSIERVKRTTKTLIILQNGERFKNTLGAAYGTGENWFSLHIAIAEPDKVKKYGIKERKEIPLIKLNALILQKSLLKILKLLWIF